MNWIEVNLTVSNSGRSRTVSKRAERIQFRSTSGTLRPPRQPGWCSPVALSWRDGVEAKESSTRHGLGHLHLHLGLSLQRPHQPESDSPTPDTRLGRPRRASVDWPACAHLQGALPTTSGAAVLLVAHDRPGSSQGIVATAALMLSAVARLLRRDMAQYRLPAGRGPRLACSKGPRAAAECGARRWRTTRRAASGRTGGARRAVARRRRLRPALPPPVPLPPPLERRNFRARANFRPATPADAEALGVAGRRSRFVAAMRYAHAAALCDSPTFLPGRLGRHATRCHGGVGGCVGRKSWVAESRASMSQGCH